MTCDVCPIELIITKRPDKEKVVLALCNQCGRVRQYPITTMTFEKAIKHLHQFNNDGKESNEPIFHFCYQCNISVILRDVKNHYKTIKHDRIKTDFHGK